MSTKQDLLNEAVRQYKAFHEAIQGLNEQHLTEVWLGTWSVRDIVAHMSGWHRELGPALERLARGERPVPEGKNYEANVDLNTASHDKEHAAQIRAWRTRAGW